MVYNGRIAFLRISRKLARKCHKNSKKKEREGWEGEESEGAEQQSFAGSSLHYKYFADLNPFSTYT
jgi:hypothetical protein